MYSPAVAILLLSVAIGVTPTGRNTSVTRTAKGTFDVKVTPVTTTDSLPTGDFPRLALAKTFHGDMTGTSVGQMVASDAAPTGWGAYVAMERVTATLDGKQGSFILMHNGTMTPTSMELKIQVAPGSGTGELEKIEGIFRIIIEGKKHLWEFDYTLP